MSNCPCSEPTLHRIPSIAQHPMEICQRFRASTELFRFTIHPPSNLIYRLVDWEKFASVPALTPICSRSQSTPHPSCRLASNLISCRWIHLRVDRTHIRRIDPQFPNRPSQLINLLTLSNARALSFPPLICIHLTCVLIGVSLDLLLRRSPDIFFSPRLSQWAAASQSTMDPYWLEPSKATGPLWWRTWCPQWSPKAPKMGTPLNLLMA